MDVLEAVASRYSCRAFLPTPVPEKIVRDITNQIQSATGADASPEAVRDLTRARWASALAEAIGRNLLRAREAEPKLRLNEQAARLYQASFPRSE